MRQASWLLAAPFACLAISSALAADSWVVTGVHGAVLALVGGQWREVSSGDRVGNGIALRTLQAGGAKLQRGGEEIGLAANTVVRPGAAQGRPTIEQYAGVVTLVATGRTTLRLITPNYVVATASGSLVSRLATPSATLYVRRGEADLTVGRRRLLLTPGQSYSSRGNWQGLITSGAAGAGGPAPAAEAGTQDGIASDGSSTPDGTPDSASASAADNDGAPGNAAPAGASSGPPKTDNGVGNGGTPGNGGQNGNAGGNGNGRGAGNGGKGQE